MKLGLLNLLPGVVLAGWLAGRFLLQGQPQPWQWGRRHVTLPFLGLTLLGLLSLEPALTRRTFIHGGGLLLAWLVYLYIINERPNLTLPLALVVISQSLIGVAQFWRQADLGLIGLGELPLNPAFEGVTVLWARDQPWLRAYGLTAHPNLLGAILTILLLFLLPAAVRQRGWRQLGLIIVTVLGLLGLLVSFSRTAWLGFAFGLLAWLLFSGRLRRPAIALHPLTPQHSYLSPTKGRRITLALLALLPVLLIFYAYRDLVFSRFLALDTPIEARSIDQRLYDARLALRIIAGQPWSGIGLGAYWDVARTFDPDAAVVHNVPLLVTAELGLPGLFLWLWLVTAPFWTLRRGAKTRPHQHATPLPPLTPSPPHPLSPAQLTPWAAMLVMSFFDTMVWFSSNWQTAILFALLMAHLTWNITRPALRSPT
jgi:O-antigen ligase